MRLFLVSEQLLVLLTVLSLTRAQTTSAPTTAETTTTPEPTTTLAETTTPEPTATLAETTTLATTSAITTNVPTTTPLAETTAVTPETTTRVETSTTGITPPAPTTLSATATTTPWTAPEIFYPFGAAVGDANVLETGSETSKFVTFSNPFTYFGRKYNSTYVNNNGLITFNQPLPEAHPPYPFPTYGNEDYIAPLWTDLDDLGIGRCWYQQYTNGSVLTRATQDINQYFPGRGFSASWVFVVTWDYVLTWDMNVFNNHSGPAITFQAVLISGDGFSFILMHYGDCAGEQYAAQAGYDTIGSTDYYQIHHNPNNGSSIPILKTTTNVDVPGRWAFLVNNGSEIVIGVQMKLRSFSDLTQSGNIELVLHQIKQELINHGVSSNFELKLRKVKKTQS
ncbi:sushi, nidogen and EGF-like domain-containing protein 1 isoform X2 [Onychostoma macrolepis]|uniref:sushi, nidogen and EGF-like domain-containing protein 1 isoform X2 n=1 Tax=Onychostoma macrolepis TaxID=369639 RepID=UPI00272ABDA7|nr:sushi, nidogen and EGF-like domain-containing protein 1 isoform X2 [Onychostoma macrolepis]